MELKEWVRTARKHKGLTQEQLAHELGMTKGNISGWENGRHQPSYAQLLKIQQLTNYKLAPEFDAALDFNVLPKQAMGLPVVGTAKLGDDGNFCELEHPVGHGDGRIDWPSRDPNAYALRCKGDSMKPRIKHGEYVIVEPNHTPSPGDEVLVKAKDGRVMVKQLAYIRDGMVYLDSVNEIYPRFGIAEDQIVKFHYIAGIAKSALWRPD